MASVEKKWALVTGATGGLGRAFCEALARRGYSLVVSARQQEALERMAGELAAAHGVEAVAFAADLTERGAGTRLKQAVDARGIAIETLVNNAGFALHGRFVSHPVERHLAMMDVNNRVLAELSHLFASDMAARGGGHVLLVASTAAYQPIPGYAVYAASKAFVLSLGYALRAEMRRRKVVVTVLSPGPTVTEFWERAGHKTNVIANMLMMKPGPVAEAGLDGLFRGKASVVPGLANKLITLSGRFLPRSLQARGAAIIMGKGK